MRGYAVRCAPRQFRWARGREALGMAVVDSCSAASLGCMSSIAEQ
jgi:hypothetical protein